MNHDVMAQLARDRRAWIALEYNAGLNLPEMRPLLARVLRATGEGIFRLGVALDERVCAAAAAETPLL